MVENIRIRDVYKIYQSGTLTQRIETVALRGISIEIKLNDFITVMGPSGSGKTTLLNILGGLDSPSAGDIIFEKKSQSVNITKLSESQLDSWRHDKIGVIFQNDSLLHHLTALENVTLPLHFLGEQNGNRAIKLLTRLGLGDRLHHRTYQLSAGERQRVALAAALVIKPDIILADEPTGELDSQTVADVMNIFTQLHKEEEIIFFLVTHNPTVAKYGNRFFTLDDGYLAERDEPFTYDDFASRLGEYKVRIDKHHRLVIPLELLREINPPEGMVQLSMVDNNKLIITNADLDASDDELDLTLAQVDGKNRVLLPREIWKSMKNSQPLIGLFDETNQRIILEGGSKND
ncbi:MAG: ABC transporter ATP-binding protein [Candidatus Hodarchaeales archaeon]|jgi:putative ABC transport system ATP-binding protein